MAKLIDLTARRFGRLLVLERDNADLIREKVRWICQCDCGKRKSISGENLKSGASQSCGCLQREQVSDRAKTWAYTRKAFHNPFFKDLTGKMFGRLKVVKHIPRNLIPPQKLNKGRQQYWECLCGCGKSHVIISRSLLSGRVVSCGCFKKEKKNIPSFDNPRWEGVGELSQTYVSSLKYGAKERNLNFSVTKTQLWGLFLKQGRKCALSGIKIGFDTKKTRNPQQTASLDRIDSSKGYTIDNVQWVHKSINLMKQAFSQDDFIKCCQLVSNNFNLT